MLPPNDLAVSAKSFSAKNDGILSGWRNLHRQTYQANKTVN